MKRPAWPACRAALLSSVRSVSLSPARVSLSDHHAVAFAPVGRHHPYGWFSPWQASVWFAGAWLVDDRLERDTDRRPVVGEIAVNVARDAGDLHVDGVGRMVSGQSPAEAIERLGLPAHDEVRVSRGVEIDVEHTVRQVRPAFGRFQRRGGDGRLVAVEPVIVPVQVVQESLVSRRVGREG